jgi:hypothetical protein
MDCQPYTLTLPPAPVAELRVYQLSPGAQVQLTPLWGQVSYRVEEGHLVLVSATGGTVLLRDYLSSLTNTHCPAALTLPKGATRAKRPWQWQRTGS